MISTTPSEVDRWSDRERTSPTVTMITHTAGWATMGVTGHIQHIAASTDYLRAR